MTEWQAYYELEPFGEERADLRAGIVAATVYNRHRDPKREQARKPIDFMPFVEPAAREATEQGPAQGQTWQQQLRIVERLNRLFGGKDERAKRSASAGV